MLRDRLSLTPYTKLWILISDAMLFLLSILFVYTFRFSNFNFELFYDWSLWLILLIWLSCLYIFGLYDVDREDSFFSVLGRMSLGLLAAIVVSVLLNYLSGKDRSGLFGRGVLLGSLVLNGMIFLFWRGFLRKIFHVIQSRLDVFVLAKQEDLPNLEKEFQKNPFQGRTQFLLDKPMGAHGAWEDLFPQLRSSSLIIIASQTYTIEERLGPRLIDARFAGHRILDLSSFYEYAWKKIPVFHLGSQWFFMNEGFSLVGSPFRLRFKRLSDLLLSFLLLVVTAPLMALTALAVKLESQGPIFYRQVRTGKDGEEFTILKFRSMTVDAEKGGAQWAQKNDSRVTRIGKWIRLTRLDELPQLFNVLRGHMSFIGPRPERPEFNDSLEKQIPYYSLRHLVRPGLTGWAQVMYPYGASVEDAREKLQYDLFYIKNFSFLFDLQIVLKTISVVLLGKGR